MDESHEPTTPAPPAQSDENFAPVERSLHAIRRRVRASLIGTRLAIILAIALAVALQAGVLDYFLRGPWWLRTLLLFASLGILVMALRRFVLPALGFRPNLIDLALRLEQSPEGKAAGLPGTLASGLDLRNAPPGDAPPLTQALSNLAVSQAAERFSKVARATILRPEPLRHALLALAGALIAIAGVGALSSPTMLRIGAQRVLLPWSGAEWPKRTMIADASDVTIRAVTQPLELRALLTKSDAAPGRARVHINYRLIENGVKGPSLRVPLVARSDPLDPKAEPQAKGEIYETTLEPRLLIAGTAATSETAIEYWFESRDDATPTARVLLVRPPEIASASVTITPPAYAATALAEGRTGLVSGTLDLGPGNDQRAAVGPILAGSLVDLWIQFTKPVPAPTQAAMTDARVRDEWLAKNFPNAALGESFIAELAPDRWRLRWTIQQATRLPITPVDEHGVAGSAESVYSFDTRPDQAPAVAITQPREDENVLPTAIVPITGEARDDVSIAGLVLQQVKASAPANSQGAPPEAVGEPSTFATAALAPAASAESTPDSQPGSLPASDVAATLDLGPLDLKPGDEVWVTALASDLFVGADGATREPTRSQPRRLRIIAPQDLVNQIRAGLNSVRDAAMKLDEDQARARQAVSQGLVSAAERHRQRQLSPRLQQQGQSVQRLIDRARQNQLDDPGLEGLLEDAQSLLEDAQRASDLASSKLEQAAKGEDPAELNAEEQKDVGQQQDAVREQLGELIRALDRGQDNWLVRRDVQRLLQQQQELARQTQRVGEQTTGKQAEQLTPQERGELSGLSQRQEQLSDQAMRVLDELQSRSEQLKQADPSQSQAMKQAAQRGRQQQLQRAMDQAAKQLEQNQNSQAQEQQARAQQALEQMLQDMDQAQRNRDLALRRELQGLTEAIEALIARQERELAILASASERNDLTGLDAGLVTLHGNTLGAVDQAQAIKEAASAMRLLQDAGEAQSKAIVALRASPADGPQAKEHEEASLARLRDALAEAKRLEEQAEDRDTNRQRRELRQAYREILEKQAVLNAETQTLSAKELDRRERLKVRGLGERQAEIQDELAKLREQTTEIAEAKLFDFAHDRLDRVTASAAKRLRAGKADATALRDQASTTSVLRSLVEALSQDPKEDEFRDSPGSEQGGGGEGGGQQGGQQPSMLPPIAELKLLRSMQQEAAERTRLAGDAGEDATEEISSVGEFQRRLATEGAEIIKKLMQGQDGGEEGEPEVDPRDPLPPGGGPVPAPEPKPQGGGR